MVLKHSRWMVMLLVLLLGLVFVACASNSDDDDASDDDDNGSSQDGGDNGNGNDDDDDDDGDDGGNDDGDNGDDDGNDNGDDDGNGSSGSGGNSDVLDRAQERAEQQADDPDNAETYRYEMVANFEGLETGDLGDVDVDIDDFGIMAEGAVDPPNNRSYVRFELTGFDIPGFDGFEFETIQDGNVTYSRNPFLSLFSGEDDDVWYRYEDADDADALNPAPIPQIDADDQLDVLRGLGDDFEEIGEEEVRGVRTTRYRVQVDADELRDALEDAGEDPDVIDDLEGLYEDTQFDIWLDDDGRIYRIMAEFRLSEAGDVLDSDDIDVSNAVMRMTIEYFDYGDDVDIDIPSGNDVVDGDDIFGGFGNIFDDLEDE